MKLVGAYEAKTHLPALLKRVSKGERIRITKHGVPVADLVPAHPSVQEDVKAVIAAIRELRKGNRRPKGMTVREMIEKGRP